jgi:subtilisin family serine protease
MEWFLAPTDENGENPDPTKAPHVINNSWSCPEIEGCNPGNFQLMRQAVINLREAGIVVVVSAGNSGSGCGSVSTPLAMFEESFTVGAINMQDTIARFSSRGPVEVDSSFRTKPNISAPGVQVRSAWLDSTYRNANGTSMAGPHVVGVVALMISANPDLAGQVELIEDILEATARPKITEQECGGTPGTEEWNNTFGHGVVDALAAVEAALLLSATSESPDREAEQLVFYPNPASADLNILSRGDTHVIDMIRIYTTEGQLVRVQRNISLPGRIHLSGLSQGLYIVHADQYPPALIHVIHE